MSQAQFKDPVSHMCLAGTVVASWSLTEEVAEWQGLEPFQCNDKYFVTEFSEFSENIQEKLQCLQKDNYKIQDICRLKKEKIEYLMYH